MTRKLEVVAPASSQSTPIDFLLRYMNDPSNAMVDRMEVAFTLLPYCHEVKSKPSCACDE